MAKLSPWKIRCNDEFRNENPKLMQLYYICRLLQINVGKYHDFKLSSVDAGKALGIEPLAASELIHMLRDKTDPAIECTGGTGHGPGNGYRYRFLHRIHKHLYEDQTQPAK